MQRVGFCPSVSNILWTIVKEVFKLEKIGIIDLGSNSARLVIVNLFADGYFMVIDELKESIRLGQDMERDGFLKPQRVGKLLKR